MLVSNQVAGKLGFNRQPPVNLELKTPVNSGEVYFSVQGVKIKCPKSEEFSGINT